MKITKDPNFTSVAKDKSILLDTSIFIDTSLHPSKFQDFFEEMRSNNSTLATIEPVFVEFTKGAANENKFDAKKKLIEDIIDVDLPIRKETLTNLRPLIKKYREDGKSASITDLFLGATLMHYRSNLLLLTKDVKDFPTNIFKLESYLHLEHRKALQVYVLLSYNEPGMEF